MTRGGEGYIYINRSQERAAKLIYMEQYSCRPPPVFMLLVSLSQICMFVYHVILLTNQGHTVGPDGPVYLKVSHKHKIRRGDIIDILILEPSDI